MRILPRASLALSAHEAIGELWHETRDLRIGCVAVPKLSSLKRHHEETAAPLVLNTESVAYILETPELPGKFDATKAKALGIPPGPLYGKVHTDDALDITAMLLTLEPCFCLS